MRSKLIALGILSMVASCSSNEEKTQSAKMYITCRDANENTEVKDYSVGSNGFLYVTLYSGRELMFTPGCECVIFADPVPSN